MVIRKVGDRVHLLVIGGNRSFQNSKKQFNQDYINKVRFFSSDQYEEPDFIIGIDVTDSIGNPTPLAEQESVPAKTVVYTINKGIVKAAMIRRATLESVRKSQEASAAGSTHRN